MQKILQDGNWRLSNNSVEQMMRHIKMNPQWYIKELVSHLTSRPSGYMDKVALLSYYLPLIFKIN